MNDLKFAVRQLLKSPGFTAVALLSLALGIGAGTAVFSLINAILLGSLPVPDPQELRVIEWRGIRPQTHNFTGAIRALTPAPPQGHGRVGSRESERMIADAFTYPMFMELRKVAAGRGNLFGYCDLHQVTLRGRRPATTADGLLVSDNFFSGLGVKPQLGRLPDAEENIAGGELVALISDRLWRNEFGLDPEVLGETLRLDGHAFTIIGVLPRDFEGVDMGAKADFYVTMAAQPQLRSFWSLTATDDWWIKLMARMEPGANEVQFQTTLNTVFAREAGSRMKEPKVVVEEGRAGPTWQRDRSYRKPLLLLLGIVAIVVLIACANLAGLLLARDAARRHEFAVRAALGASRWRLIRQSLAESLVLALAGGGAGVLVALWAKGPLARLLAGQAGELHFDPSLDWRVIGFAAATALLAAIGSGFLPAWRNGRVAPQTSLRDGTAAASPRLVTGKVLVAAQVALALLLLAGAGLFVRTLINLVVIHPGFAVDRLLIFHVNPAAAGYHDQRTIDFIDRSQAAVASIPGVRSVGMTQFPLLIGVMSGGTFTLPGRPVTEGPKPQAYRLTVSESFFGTMGIGLRQGRGFTSADAPGAPLVVVVNQTFANRYFDGMHPIGQIVNALGKDRRIVGVCTDAKYQDLKADVPPTIYFPYRQDEDCGGGYLVVRTSMPPLSLVPAARRAIAAIDPNVPLAEITTQEQILNEKLGRERLFATLCTALALLAVLLACIGIYGLIAYHVARRTGEIGIRIALGATRWKIAGPILREALLLGGVGVTVGVLGALALSRLIQGLLYGVEPNDPLSFCFAVLALLLVAVVAAWIPAWRAARVHPMRALRTE